MILPATYLSGIILMIVALFCAGSWTSAFKAASPFRYELYYFDLSVGAVLCAVVAALTFGSLHANELTFTDNFLVTSYRLMAYAVAAGVIFSLGAVILLAGISVGGVALCVPVAFGIAFVIDAAWDFLLNPRINALLLFGGAAVVLAAMVLLALAHLRHRRALDQAVKKALQLDPRSKEARRKPKPLASGVPIALALVSGIVFSFPPHVLTAAREGDNGVAPYGLILLFSAGMLFSAIALSPFVINFPIGGAPAAVSDYFRASFRGHFLGILGGALLCAGALAGNLVIGSPAFGMPGPALVAGLGQAGPLVAILWGAIVWREYRGGNESVWGLLWGGFLLYGLGTALISFAPLYGSR
jgi:glucose uptake protein